MKAGTKLSYQQPRGHKEVPLQRRRSPTPTPQTGHGVVHRKHRESAKQTRQRRARAQPQTGHDLVVPERLPPSYLSNLNQICIFRITKTLRLIYMKEKNTSINCNDVTVSSALRSPLHVCVPKEEYMLVVSDTAHLRVCEALGKVIVFLLDSFEFFLHLLTSFFSTS